MGVSRPDAANAGLSLPSVNQIIFEVENEDQDDAIVARTAKYMKQKYLRFVRRKVKKQVARRNQKTRMTRLLPELPST